MFLVAPVQRLQSVLQPASFHGQGEGVLALGGIGLGADLGRGSGQGPDLIVGPRGLAQDDRGRAGDDRAGLIGAAAAYVPPVAALAAP